MSKIKTKYFSKLFICCTAILCVFFAGLSSAVALTIDEFNGIGKVESSSGNTPNTLAISNPAIIGGTRNITAEYITGSTSVSIETKLGYLFHAAGPSTAGVTQVVYNKNGAGLGGINLKQDFDAATIGTAAFVLNVFSNDQPTPNASIEITVLDTVGGGGSVVKTIGCVNAPSCVANAPADLLFPFSEFVGVDLTKVNSIRQTAKQQKRGKEL